MRVFLGVIACALFASCAHVYDDGFGADAGSWRDQDGQAEEGKEGSETIPRDQGSGDEGGGGDRDAGSPSGNGQPPMVVGGPGEPGAAMDAGRPLVEDAAVVQLFEPITVQSEVSSEHATPNDDIAILWRVFEPSKQYEPQRVEIEEVEGGLSRFRVLLPDEPPLEGRYPLEDPETGVSYEGALNIAAGAIYQVVHGKLESNPEGVNALDVDTVIGQTKAWLVWTPVDLPAGWQHGARVGTIESDAPLSAGYHLFIGGVEVDMGTLITMGDDIWT